MRRYDRIFRFYQQDAGVVAAGFRRIFAGLYKFLSGPLECKPEDVASMELDALLSALRQVAEENNLTAFFDSASGILGRT